MPMTVIVTRDVASRYRGYLASVALEIAPGVYTAPRMTRRVRERVWSVLCDWWDDAPGGAIVMTWWSPRSVGGQEVAVLGLPPVELREVQGLVLARRDIPPGKRGDEDEGGADAAAVRPDKKSERQ